MKVGIIKEFHNRRTKLIYISHRFQEAFRFEYVKDSSHREGFKLQRAESMSDSGSAVLTMLKREIVKPKGFGTVMSWPIACLLAAGVRIRAEEGKKVSIRNATKSERSIVQRHFKILCQE